MIAAKVVAEVCRMLAEGKHSQRAIARLTGICRGSVATIASGKWAERRALRGAAEEGIAETAGPPQRCPGCGAMVTMPCVLCQVLERQASAAGCPSSRAMAASVRRPLAQKEIVLGLELRSEHRVRYEEVFLRKREEEAAEVAICACGF